MRNGIVLAVVMGIWVAAGIQLVAAPPSDEQIAAALDNDASIQDLMKDQSPQDAAAIAERLMKAAIAKGGAENALKNRIARLVGACIGASGANGAAVAAALVKAAGKEYNGLVVAAVVVAAKAAKADSEALGKAAAAAAEDAETAKDAQVDPYKYLGRVRAWMVERSAVRFSEPTPVTTTTTTSTSTTTAASPTPVGLD